MEFRVFKAMGVFLGNFDRRLGLGLRLVEDPLPSLSELLGELGESIDELRDSALSGVCACFHFHLLCPAM